MVYIECQNCHGGGSRDYCYGYTVIKTWKIRKTTLSEHLYTHRTLEVDQIIRVFRMSALNIIIHKLVVGIY